jgi:shikimate dehydrogenase
LKIDNQTQLFISAAIKPGNFGASIYNHLFKNYKMNAVYMPKKVCDLASLFTALKTLDIKGCSVTMPFKSQVIPYLDGYDKVVKKTQSVNTIINKSGKLIGRNTDQYGAYMVLKEINPTSVLIYGSGSVVSSIVMALKELGCNEIEIHARNPNAAQKTASLLGVKTFTFSSNIKRRFHLLINATPTSNIEESEVFKLLLQVQSLFDLTVSPKDTELCAIAKKKGMSVTAGVEMSKWQLQKQFHHYTGKLPNINIIDEAIYELYQ